MSETLATPKVWWRTGLVLGAIAAALAFYWPSAQALLAYWNDTESKTYTHGHLIVLLSLGLLLRDRKRIAAAPLDSQPLAALGLLLTGLVWLVCYNAAIQIGHLLLLPVLMWGAVYAVFGWPTARLCLFPLGYLYFAVPIWDFINGAAQWGTVFAVRSMLRVVSIPAFFHEQFVQIPSGSFEIAGGCSGLHFLIVGLALAVLLGELRRDSSATRIKLAALALGLALLSNWLRVFIIIVAGHLTDMQHYLVRVNHYYFGWAVFAAIMAVFFFLARRIGEDAPHPRTNEAVVRPMTRKSWIAAALAVLALGLPSGWGLLNTATAGLLNYSPWLPKPPAGWSATAAAAFDSWEPKFENADRGAKNSYINGGSPVEVFTAVYFHQRQGKELSGYKNSVTGDLLKTTASTPASAAGKPFIELSVTDSLGRSWLLWYSYAVGDRWFADVTRAQAWYGVRSLAGPKLSRVLMLRSPCEPDCASARQTLKTFIEQGVLE